MIPDARTTMDLLAAWHRGDKNALHELVQRHAPWLHTHVRRKMTHLERRFETSEDVVHTVLLNLIRSGPAFLPPDEETFRALIAQCVKNRLIDLSRRARSEKHDPEREEPLPSHISHIGKFANSSERPDRQSERSEERGFIALALELADPEDRAIIQQHEFEGVEFKEIGERLGMSEDAARHRFNRAVARLGQLVQKLKRGELDDLKQDLDEPTAGVTA